MEHPDSIHTQLEGLAPFVALFFESRGVPGPSDFNAFPIQADGSNRSFFRIRHPSHNQTFIAVLNPPLSPFPARENTAYLKIGKHLRRQGAPIPEIFQWDLEAGCFLVEDMGDLRLQEALSAEDRPQELEEDVLKALLNMQLRGAEGFNPSWCCQTSHYDRKCMRQFESDYFRDAFLSQYIGLDRDLHELETPFVHLASMAAGAEAGFFMHRDFQSRNVLITDKGPAFVDWQGGRMGPLGYDLASFLLDPYAGRSEAHGKRLYLFYLEMLRDRYGTKVQSFEDTFPYLAIQRNLQILGAFGFLSRVRGKKFFETYIPAAALSLLRLLEELKDPRLDPIISTMESTRRLWAGG